jgi:hypothetical protein
MAAHPEAAESCAGLKKVLAEQISTMAEAAIVLERLDMPISEGFDDLVAGMRPFGVVTADVLAFVDTSRRAFVI